MTTIRAYEIDQEVVTAAAQMVGYWNAGEVLSALNVSEGFTLAALLDALHEHDAAAHVIREVWEGESEDSRDPLPWVNGHGSRLSEREYRTRADDLAHNEGAERFHFDPRLDFDDESSD
ncbi:hypothetical protein [Microbacterium sp. CH12i]|uniref:hypothetical protein n=1 Tax=Microbacterium sp. CH12i TaxID=1479651 RepID=UPI00126795BB|nr:hypothetical protein [Microbacterium sp. CH12i]